MQIKPEIKLEDQPHRLYHTLSLAAVSFSTRSIGIQTEEHAMREVGVQTDEREREPEQQMEVGMEWWLL